MESILKFRKEKEHFDLKSTLRTILVFRVVIVTALLGSALYVQVFFGTTNDSLYFIIGLTYLVTLFYAILATPLKRNKLFIVVQLLIDELLVSILVLVTGAIDSSFVILYYLPVITAAVTVGRYYSYTIAGISSIIFAVICLSANGGLVDLSFIYSYSQPETNTLVYTIFLHLSALVFLASISGYLANLLHSTAATLRERTVDLKHLQILNQSIIQSITSGIITTDMSGNVRFANPEAKKLLALDDKDIAGKHIYNFLAFDANAPQAIVSGEQWSREMLLQSADGSAIEVNVRRNYLLGEETDPTGKLYLIQDMRELRELRNRLRVRDRLATAGEMSAAIAHEIRNPLGAISGSAQIMRKSPDLDGEQKYLMDIIVKESERLSSTLNEFLTFTKQPNYSPNEIDLLPVVKETVGFISNSPQVRADHKIHLHCDELRSLKGMVDPNMFKQLIYNLTLNGIKAMPDGGDLDVYLSRVGEKARLQVKDNGVGVTPEHMDRIFQPFTSGSVKGIGLGLAIVYKIVQEHGGQIKVRSMLGMGTSMIIYLPLIKVNRSEFNVTVEKAEP